ncbi:MAG: polymer-forming cytoskeletal protein [Chlorobi bacterium]|nr:polymer-forming cytoskeletal protein [Chlorobiota bacterium]
MFSDKKRKNGQSLPSKQPNRLGIHTRMKGEIVSEEDFRIDGTFEGDFRTSGKLVVGEKGRLKGTIRAGQAEIMGQVSGELIVEGLLSLKHTAVIEGNVQTGKLAVEQGATFNATCEMTGQKSPKGEPQAAKAK